MRCRVMLTARRQRQGEFAAFAGLAAHCNCAAMAGDDAVHHRQPETRAVTDPFGREKGLEDAISGGPIHSAASVGDGKADDWPKPSLARREQLLRIGPKADGNLADSAADRVGGVGFAGKVSGVLAAMRIGGVGFW